MSPHLNPYIEWSFSLRPLLRMLGVFMGLSAVIGVWKRPVALRLGRWVSEQLDPFCEKHYRALLMGLGGVIFGLGLLAKSSQLYSLQFEAQDFWLFVDLLEQSSRGGAFLTRFAPQAQGFVQHGVVHPNFSYLLFVPLVWVLGPVWAALVAQALAGALGGIGLALLSLPEWGKRNSLLWMLAFCFSSYWGKVLMYEVHPEAFYPAFYFFWIGSLRALQLKAAPRQFALSLVFLLLLLGVKEDAFLLVLPVLAVYSLGRLRNQDGLSKQVLLAESLVAGFGIAFQFWAVGALRSGVLGPSLWQGLPVVREFSIAFLKGGAWTGVGSAWQVLTGYAESVGGLLGWLSQLVHFFFSKPFLSLLVLAPWVFVLPRFWLVVLPLAAVTCVLEGPRVLWNYYSAPFLCVVYGLAVEGKKFWRLPRGYFPVAALGLSLLFGGGSYVYSLPSQQAISLRDQVKQLLPTLGAHGWVASQLIGLLPLEKVAYERPPDSGLEKVDFVLVIRGVDRYRLSQDEVSGWIEKLRVDASWEQRPVPGDSEQDKLVFFKRK